MVQLLEVPKKEKIFNKNYAFYSSTSKYMDLHFKRFSENIKNFIKLKRIAKPLIVEIGSNDGIMLKRFKNMDHVGIELIINFFEKLNLEKKYFFFYS